MSSLVRPGRVLRTADEPEEVFILGESVRANMPALPPVARASELLRSAGNQSDEMIARAERTAREIVEEAERRAGEVRSTAYADGFEAGRAAAIQEFSAYVALACQASSDGKALRDGVAEQSLALIARATGLAVRKIVGEYYEADPARTAAACAEALRAASGQQILSIRVHPGLVAQVQAALVDVADYIRPDDAVEIGGCVVDLQHGTIDASLDARLSLMELALREAAGGEVEFK